MVTTHATANGGQTAFRCNSMLLNAIKCTEPALTEALWLPVAVLRVGNRQPASSDC